MTDDLRARLDAVERAVTDADADIDTDTDFGGVADAATVADRRTTLEERLDAVETRLAELDASTQALRGYLGGVDGVTDDVERQASLALAKAEMLEAHVFDDDDLAVEHLPMVSPPSASPANGDGAIDDPPQPCVGSDEARHRDEPASSLLTRVRDAL